MTTTEAIKPADLKDEACRSVLDQITDTLIAAATAQKISVIVNLMRTHYINFRLMDADGQWVSEALDQISHQLIDPDLTAEKASLHIQRIKINISNNTYLCRFLNHPDRLNELCFTEDNIDDAIQILPSLIAYALVLEALTKAVQNRKILETCKDIWLSNKNPTTQRIKNKKSKDIFGRLKRRSLNGITNYFLKIHETGHVRPSFLKAIIPFNLFTAIIDDHRLGLSGNAHCGRLLLKTLILRRRTNKAFSSWSPEESILKIDILEQHSKQWIDMYCTWVMAFMTKYSAFPFAMVPLLIPPVSGYSQAPENFFYFRGLALYIHLHYPLGKIRINGEKIQWQSPDLTQAWSTHNKEVASIYAREYAELGKNEKATKRPPPNTANRDISSQ